MKHPLHTGAPFARVLLVLALLWGSTSAIFAEGSADFINRAGHRLHLVGFPNQQFKVYAAEGEFINVGSSNLAQEGTIKVYRPNGTLASTFDFDSFNAGGVASIDSLTEEIAGPVGEALGGYTPGVVAVATGEAGVWTVVFTCSNGNTNFPNLLNNQNWTAEYDQGINMTIIAWDVTVSKNAPADQGGQRLKGRLFSQELSTFIRDGDHPTSPLYYVLTRDGFLYKVQLQNLDPVRFWFSSNNVGIVNGGTKEPNYKSIFEADYTISSDIANWNPNGLYYFDPQEPDNGIFVNNKVFINPPAADLPQQALTTNVFKNNSYTTWLNPPPATLDVLLGGFTIGGSNGVDTCFSGSIQQGIGGTFHFTSNQMGVAEICLDINNNGSYFDPVDRKVYGDAINGMNGIFWDGKDGLGNDLPSGNLAIPYKLSIRAGGMHILYRDVENSGGFTLELQNTNLGQVDVNSYYFDHSEVGGGVSGGGTPGNPLPQNTLSPYSNGFGDMKLMNYWKFYTLSGSLESVINIIIKDDCVDETPDHDGDGVGDDIDLDDENDGVPDVWEYCNPAGTFACLPNALDPSGDEDGDAVLNFQDSNDPAYPNTCNDANTDGICDNLPAALDTDGDGVADHLDLDSDNDGITDLDEAGHGQADANGNGVIDGLPAAFGPNGLYDPIDSDPSSATSTATYVRWDFDKDGVPDHDDLDSDNDGINDVIEAEFYTDANGDGRLDGPSNANGIATVIDPAVTGNPIPNPIDIDNDGAPDWHDLDSDNDGIWDVMEGGVPDPDFDGISGTGVPAVNAHGQPAATTSNPTNTDGDALPDFRELDSDNDNIPDADECSTGTPCRDLDGDGHPDFQDPDRDDDHISDNWECETSTPCVDTDGDGTPDVDDADSDNDGQPDIAECPNDGPCPDGNMNGIPDFREFDCTVFVPGGLPNLTNVSGAGAYCTGSTVVLTGENNNPTLIGPAYFVIKNSKDSIIAEGNLPTVTSTASFTFSNISAAEADTYTLILAGKNGCATTATFTVSIISTPATPNLIVSNAAPCEGSDATLSFTPTTPGANYQWFFNGNPLTTTTDPSLSLTNFSPANAGDYHVVVNAGACSSPVSNTVSIGIVNAPTNLTAGNSLSGPVCEGGSATLTLPTVPGATYAWTGPNGFTSSDQNPVISPLTTANTGGYSAIVTVSGCPYPSTETTLAVNATPTTPMLATANSAPCAGSNVSLTATASAGATSYNWFFNGNPLTTTSTPVLDLPNYSAANVGSYSVVAQGVNCASANSNAIAMGIVDPGVALTAGNSLSGPVCEGGSATLTLPTVPGASYAWTGPNGFTSNQQNPVISPLTVNNAGSYSAIVTLNGCQFPSTSTSIGVNATPSTPTLIAVANPPCVGSTAALQATNAGGSATYEWFFNGNPLTTTTVPSLILPNYSAANVGAYTVVINGGTCSSPASNAVNMGIVDPGVALTAGNNSGAGICAGGSVTLTMPTVPGATYAWTGPNGYTSNQQNPVISPATTANSGTYTCTVSLSGCQFPSTPTTVTVKATPATPTLTAAPLAPCPGSTLTLTTAGVAGVSYEWFFNGGAGSVSLGTTTVPTFSVNNFSAANNGQYSVVTTLNGCKSANSNTVSVTGVAAPADLTAGNSIGGAACEGASATLTLPTVPGATYAWTGPNGFTSNQQNPTISPLTPANSGTYSAVVTVGGCPFNSTSTAIQVTPLPAAASLTNNGPICSNATGVLTVSNPVSGATYRWFDAAGNLVGTTQTGSFTLPSPPAGGSYTVQVEVGGCTSAVSAATNLVVDQLPNISATVLDNQIYNCGGTSATVEAVAPTVGTGVWTSQTPGLTFGNANLPVTTVSGLASGTSFAVWTLSSGACVNYSSATVEIISEGTVGAADDAYTIAEGMTLSGATITANDPLGGVLNWTIQITQAPKYGTATLSGDKLNYTPNKFFNGTDELEYTICSQTCPNLCATATVRIKVGDEFFIPNVITPNDDGKNDGLVIPGLDAFPDNRLCVFNRWGDIVIDHAPYKNDWKGTWNDEDLPAGTYFIMLFPDKANKDNVYSQYMTIVR